MQSYLPQLNKRILCACLGYDANPEAPRVVLVGNRPNVIAKAHLLEEQTEPIPVFLKRKKNEWEYKGYFRFAARNEDPVWLADRVKQAGREDVVMALMLEPVDNLPE